MTRTYLTTTIPFVNARPHLGFALELVQADVLARHCRRRGDEVRFLTGTDENSLKNVLAAEAEGIAVQELVDRNAAAFEGLRTPLDLSFDDFIRTSSDPRHRAGVERLWQRCADAGDLYRKHYEGLYCVGCEQFYQPEDLADGRCPDHGTEPQLVAEKNWFFRLSRYAEQLRELITSGKINIQPATRRNEVLALIDSGLHDFSISRSQRRARGWGIPVPGDPDQVVYVWWDALVNYVSSLGYGIGSNDLEHWWQRSDNRIHLLGKGVVRFHAVYWPAILLSADLALPTEILVHDYLTVDGRKISKSAGTPIDPAELVDEVGADAVRWWLLRDVPRIGDADFTRDRLIARSNSDLAGGLGNLVNRVVSLIHRYYAGRVPALLPAPGELRTAVTNAPGQIETALANYDFRKAATALWDIVESANRYIETTEPWQLAKTQDPLLTKVLATLHHACLALAGELSPFLPSAAARITTQCTPIDGILPPATPLFPRLT
ncbi:methionine--tRNA ligase [Kribbella sp. NBC_00382]|uniref:methionine--tRNA ligase n=1 Tax=Kribbella sp. NBC_00382 TaxID=2975967 RepID=UPI002E1A970D